VVQSFIEIVEPLGQMVYEPTREVAMQAFARSWYRE
jgi:hypothetical protein